MIAESNVKKFQREVYTLSALISGFVGSVLSGKEIPNIDDVWEKQTKQLNEEQLAKQDAIVAEKFRAFAKNFNSRFEEDK